MTEEKFTPGEWRTDRMYIYHGEDKIVCQMWGSGSPPRRRCIKHWLNLSEKAVKGGKK